MILELLDSIIEKLKNIKITTAFVIAAFAVVISDPESIKSEFIGFMESYADIIIYCAAISIMAIVYIATAVLVLKLFKRVRRLFR